MINSVLVGSFVGVLLVLFTLPLWVYTCAGVVAFRVSVGLHQRYQWKQWMHLEYTLPVLFPSQLRQEKPEAAFLLLPCVAHVVAGEAGAPRALKKETRL